VRAVTIKDGDLIIAEHPDPLPGIGEVLVQIRAAGLNGADIHQRAGRYPAPPDSPQDIPGLELAGEVVANGPRAARFREGDRVMGIVGGGGQAELATVHERQLIADAGARQPRLAAGGRPPGDLHDGSRRDLHPG
jgi:NADPH:quinone reductase-like Zn-dependent oxidoreductase